MAKAKYRSAETLLSQLDAEEFRDCYLKHTRKDCEAYFGLSAMEFKNLADHLGLFNIKRESKRLDKNIILSNLSENEIISLCLKHSNKELQKILNLSPEAFKNFQLKYNLKNADAAELTARLFPRTDILRDYEQNTLTRFRSIYSLTLNQAYRLLSILDIPLRSLECEYDMRKITYLKNFGKYENPDGYKCKLNKYKKSMLSIYGEDNPAKVNSLKKKAVNSLQLYKDNNKMHKSSKAEKHLLALLEKVFGSEDVIYQKFDIDLYPFNCDFYIRSLDLWIELNGWWHHGPYPFYESDINLQLLNEAKHKYPNQFASFYKVWTQSDVKKFEYARKHRLNYLVVYNDGSIYNRDKIIMHKLRSIHNFDQFIEFIKNIYGGN